ncbi:MULTISPECIES: glycosyltransferase [Aequorivita]|uniref:Glycosyltransferase n=1 Tax=Aequorivita iocasae TaxID=2803865 RepID=A0ABX7DRL6_9FLAO|nr:MULTISPECIES: glycosyltransferase [Aequorivita]QQX76790.1 glycosyltransferase [Aequorivita iocasae]UCA56262.1 glycosyltransferase [Aequorivita sp. F7]
MKPKKISILHPFSAKAVGLSEQDLFYSHSKPHEKALLKLQGEGYEVTMDYFTGSVFPFSKKINGMTKRFWPISKPVLKKRHAWRKQHSFFHYWNAFFNTPDLTIINMSGHGSAYCFKLADMLVKKQKPYVTMLGGIHISDDLTAKKYYQKAHHLIVHTEIQKRALLQNSVFKDLNIRVMPLGIDTAVFIPKEKPSSTIELLFVGRISRLKQIELCLNALHYLLEKQDKPVNLTIVGPISDETYFSELKQLAIKLQIVEHLKFIGSVEQVKLIPYYQKANLLLLPSTHESFGMVMVEAMACGTPVAAIKGSGGPDEIVENGVNGILTTKDTYAAKVLDFVQSEALAFRLSENARLVVEQKWSLSQTENALSNSINMISKSEN